MLITKVRYVHPSDPVGRMLIEAAFMQWAEELPDWRENEYARGALELLDNVLRVRTDDEIERGDLWDTEDRLDRLWLIVNSVQGAMLDETLADLGLLP